MLIPLPSYLFLKQSQFILPPCIPSQSQPVQAIPSPFLLGVREGGIMIINKEFIMIKKEYSKSLLLCCEQKTEDLPALAEMQLPQFLIHFFACHYREAADRTSVQEDQFLHAEAHLVGGDVLDPFQFFLQLLETTFPLLPAHELLQVVPAELRSAGGLDQPHDLVEDIDLFAVGQDLQQKLPALLGSPQEGEDLIHYVGLRVLLDEAIVPALRQRTACQLWVFELAPLSYTCLFSFGFSGNLER